MRPSIGFKKIYSDKRVRLANGLLSTKYMLAKWDGQPKRKPLKGEFFISGAGGWERAFQVNQDMSTEYYIAVLCED
jgi:hypothetical protein